LALLQSPDSARRVTALSVAILFAALTTATASCGARNELELADAQGAGGSGSASGTPSSSSSGAGGSVSSSGTGASGSGGGCDRLFVVDPGPVIVGDTPGSRDPQLAWYPGDQQFTLVYAAPSERAPLSLFGMVFDASGPWWPDLSQAADLIEVGSSGYALGTGPEGPMALVNQGALGNSLATLLTPISVAIAAAPFGDDTPLFASGIDGRYFYGTRQTLAAFDSLQVGSYQPDSLPQSEAPASCVGTALLAAGVPSGAGFLGAYSMVDPALPECTPEGGMGTSVGVYRYDSPPDLGGDLEETAGDRFTPIAGDPLVHLEIAATSFGAWVVWQNAGLTAEMQPPPIALRVDAKGRALVPGDTGIALAAQGWGGPLAVSAIGDTLVAAWTDNAQPSAPLIVVQLVRADGTLGPSTSLPSDLLWQTGPLRVLGQPGAERIFVTWEGGLETTNVALARIDCVGPE
jgi:hypothetical protein